MTTTTSGTPKTKLRAFWDWFSSLLLALLVVFAVRSSLIEAFKIPSGSMIPTLLVGDHIFVNKFSYGLKVPFTEWFLDEPLFVFRRSGPHRGDIIVFKYPRDESLYYIKRVIGTPGDTVEVRTKTLYINGQAISRTPAPEEKMEKIKKDLAESNYRLDSLLGYTENLGDHNPTILQDKHPGLGDEFGPYTVQPGEVFVMGDNRDYSNDSRFWGTVPMRNIRGRAFVIWLSVWISFEESARERFSFYPDRIGTILN